VILLHDQPRLPEARLPNFQGYHLVDALHTEYQTFKDPRWDRFIDEMVELPWLICCCLNQHSYTLFEPHDRARRLVAAIRDHCETLNSAGKKYISDRPDCLWRAQRTLGYSLGRIGATREELVAEAFDPRYRDGARPPVIDRYLA
jgi:hypothetical protein